jgi:hypothetical protein
MKRFLTPVLLVLLLLICLAVGACGTSSTGGSPGTSNATTPGSPATATTVKNRATSVPVASTAECGKLLALSEANQDTNPVNPAVMVFPLELSTAALCYYETAQHQTNVALIFKAYSGGNLSQNVQQQLSGSVSQVKLVNSQSVSGLGDQAQYVTITGSSTVNGVALPVKENILFVVDGAVSFGIINVIFNNVDPLGSASAATVLSDFQQIAQLVISRL